MAVAAARHGASVSWRAAAARATSAQATESEEAVDVAVDLARSRTRSTSAPTSAVSDGSVQFVAGDVDEAEQRTAHHEAVVAVGVDVHVHPADLVGRDAAPTEPGADDPSGETSQVVSHGGRYFSIVELSRVESYFTIWKRGCEVGSSTVMMIKHVNNCCSSRTAARLGAPCSSLVAGLAACGRRRQRVASRCGAPTVRGRGPTVAPTVGAPRLLPERHPCAGARRAWPRARSPSARRQRSSRRSRFDAGTEAAEALLAGSLDLTFIGPNPAINAFAKSNGEAVRIVAGSTSGGAFLVVKPEITSAEQLAGQEARHAVARQHAGRGAAGVAEGAGLRDHARGRRRRDHHPAEELDHARVVHRRRHRRCVGARAVGHPPHRRGRRHGAGRRARPVARHRRRVRHHAPDRAHRVPQRPPRRGEGGASRVSPTRSTPSRPTRRRRRPTSSPRSATITGTDAERRRHRQASFANLTFTLDPIAASLQKSADDAIVGGPARPGRPGGHLRPDAAQRDPRRSAASRR